MDKSNLVKKFHKEIFNLQLKSEHLPMGLFKMDFNYYEKILTEIRANEWNEKKVNITKLQYIGVRLKIPHSPISKLYNPKYIATNGVL